MLLSADKTFSISIKHKGVSLVIIYVQAKNNAVEL